MIKTKAEHGVGIAWGWARLASDRLEVGSRQVYVDAEGMHVKYNPPESKWISIVFLGMCNMVGARYLVSGAGF